MSQKDIFLQLLESSQITQRTPEWYAARKTRITASEAASCLIKDALTCEDYFNEFGEASKFPLNGRCANSYMSKNMYIKRKTGRQESFSTQATMHGNLFEDIAVNIYEITNKTKVYPFGLIQHPTISFIGASPDGITPDGIMLEIKCPLTRKITGIPPFHYWIQMQIQMETCNLDNCDFMECDFKVYNSLQEIETTTDNTFYYGAIVIPKYGEGKIYYIDGFNMTELDYARKILKIQDEIIINKNIFGFFDYKVIWFKLKTLSIVRVKRSKHWFESVLPQLKEVYDLLQGKDECLF